MATGVLRMFSGKMRMNFIRILPGLGTLELSPYDLDKGKDNTPGVSEFLPKGINK